MRAPILTHKRARQLRRAMTRPEEALWAMLRRNQLGLRFRRQHPIGPYILDFYCVSAGLCVEVDGPAHDDPEQIRWDEDRTHWLSGHGIQVIRFRAGDVVEKSEGVIAAIKQAAAPSTA